ncbi:hypothetical protein [Emticicia sp. C21]|uniref:hypothetical protein n=1 Tax=Emticicia sp. C21 TaxID=2302915 RepID=UPI000E34971E|nr:hypothetical protein [Emticicia sp. C21]RFS16417.1 hypothetical protein D0T08_12080 [Emticicia sp. C21]
MKTIVFVFFLLGIYYISQAQSASITISPENGINITKLVYQTKHKISVNTQSDNYGLVQQAGPVEVGTYISENNDGYASFGTTGPYNLLFSTNSAEPQLILNTLNFMGIGGVPYNALHIYGNMRISGAANKDGNTTNSILKADNDGKLITEFQTRYHSFPKSAFMPLILSDGNSIAESAQGGIYYTLAKPTPDRLEAPINLPVGAYVTGVEFHYIDNSTANLVFIITSIIPGVKTELGHAILVSDNASPGIRSIAENNINGGSGFPISPDRTYQLRISPYQSGPNQKWDGQNTQIISAKVTYKY